jgi:hypothetical protein
MAASHNDSAILSKDSLFIARVLQSLVAAAGNIQTEAITTNTQSLHNKRAAFCVAILNNPTAYAQLFAYTVATDSNVLSNATVAGTVALTAGNVDAQQALISDTNIDNAVSGQFNNFFSLT